MVIVHPKVATKADEAGAEVNKAEWNEDHEIGSTSIVPNTDSTTNLGASTLRFATLHVDEILGGIISADDNTITSIGASEIEPGIISGLGILSTPVAADTFMMNDAGALKEVSMSVLTFTSSQISDTMADDLGNHLATQVLDISTFGVDFDSATDATIGNPGAGDIRLYQSVETGAMVLKNSSGNKAALSGAVTSFIAADGATDAEKMKADVICDNILTLTYDGGTGGLPNDTDVVTGTTTGAKAVIVSSTGNETEGVLTVNTFTVAQFLDNEPITAPNNSFAAVADGSTVGDEEQINAAIASMANGGTVYLSSGTFNVGNSIVIGVDNITLTGSNPSVRLNGGATSILLKNLDTNVRSGNAVSNIRFASALEGNGIFYDCTDLIGMTMHDCDVKAFNKGLRFLDSSGIYGIYSQLNIRVSGSGSMCIESDAQATNDNTFIGLRLAGDANTVKISLGNTGSSINNAFYGCHIDGDCTTAVDIGTAARANIFSGCWMCEGSTTTAVSNGLIVDAGADSNAFVGCNFSVNCATTITDNGEGTQFLGCLNDTALLNRLQQQELLDVTSLDFGTHTELTLDTNGAVVKTQTYHTIDTFENASSDFLVNMTVSGSGEIMYLRPASSSRTITVDNETAGDGSFRIGSDFTMDGGRDMISLLGFDSTEWMGISRSDNQA